MGKLLVCWLLLCGLSLLAGCREEEKGQAGAPREELVYASTKDIRDINPHLYGGEMAAQGMVFEPWSSTRRKVSGPGWPKAGRSRPTAASIPSICAVV